MIYNNTAPLSASLHDWCSLLNLKDSKDDWVQVKKTQLSTGIIVYMYMDTSMGVSHDNKPNRGLAYCMGLTLGWGCGMSNKINKYISYATQFTNISAISISSVPRCPLVIGSYSGTITRALVLFG